MLRKNQGFTLIELLVVIAIIGILASVVLSNLNAARTKGADSAIKASLANARAQAQLFYDANQIYTDVCIDPAGVGRFVQNAVEKLNTTATVGDNSTNFTYSAAGAAGSGVCHDEIGAWAAVVSLKNSTTSSGWCVDSTGASIEITSLDAGDTTCN